MFGVRDDRDDRLAGSHTMSKDNQLSRRQSLLGIGAAGATLTGMAGCLGDDETAAETERTSDDGDDGDDENGGETTKKGRLALEVVCHEPGEAMLRVRNEATDEVEVDWKVTIDDVDLEALATLVHRFENVDELDDYDGDLDDYDDELDDYDGNDYDRLEDFLDEIGLDDVDVEDLEGKQITLEGTTLTIGKREIDLRMIAEKKGIDLDDAPIDLEKLSGTLTIPKGADETFWAGVLTEGTNVDLYYDGKKVDSVDIDAADCEHGDETKKSGEDDHDHDHDHGDETKKGGEDDNGDHDHDHDHN